MARCRVLVSAVQASNSTACWFASFFIHRSIQNFARDIASTYGPPGAQAMLFSTPQAGRRCLRFVRQRAEPHVGDSLDTVELSLDPLKDSSLSINLPSPIITALLLSPETFSLAKQYWQHTGDGASSRRAEFCHSLFQDGLLVSFKGTEESFDAPTWPSRGPRRYQRPSGSIPAFSSITSPSTVGASSFRNSEQSQESQRFLEERFGRNLDLKLVETAKSVIRRRIAGSLTSEVDLRYEPLSSLDENWRDLKGLTEHDVYLFSAGMNAIFHVHRALLSVRGQHKSICFGFPYVDTLKLLQKFGPGCIFFGHASSGDLEALENILRSGERFLGLFCEFPANPLLTCPDLKRLRELADEFDFALVVDETIGTFANVNVLHVADVVVSSLTKIFSGDSNVMGGCAILNPHRKYYQSIKRVMDNEIYEDAYWPEDIVFMERNSRDFLTRVGRINSNAEAICNILSSHPLIKSLYYPKYNPSKHLYDAFRRPDGGYGGLLSIVFYHPEEAQAFYNSLQTAKGPSLGTNFTLCSPYALLAHYQELPWVEQFGVDANLIRVSVGLEETGKLQSTFRGALEAAAAARP